MQCFKEPLGAEHALGEATRSYVRWQFLMSGQYSAALAHGSRCLNAVTALGCDPEKIFYLWVKACHQIAIGHK